MRKQNIKYLFLLPATLFIIGFVIYPLFNTLIGSFYKIGMNPNQPSGFVGLKNFTDLFANPYFWNSMKFTFTFVPITVITEFFLGLLIALLFNREIKGKKYWRSFLTLPMFAAPVGVGYLWVTILYGNKGPITNFLQLFGLKGIPWLANPHLAVLCSMIVDIWQWTPFCFIILLAALQSVPRETLEAASVDGASSKQTFFHIVLPLITPLALLTLVFRLVDSFKTFDMIYGLTQGGPGRATEIYTMYTYRTAFKFFNFGTANALGIILLAIASIIITLVFSKFKQMWA